MLKIGDTIPNATLNIMQNNAPTPVNSLEFFANKKVALFALPGAFTPTCSTGHLPSYIKLAQQIKEKGIDIIACLSVNDPFVMQAWADQLNVNNSITMLADGSAQFTQKANLQLDLTDKGFGIRSQRYAMIIDNSIVKNIWIEDPGQFKVSGAEHLLQNI